MNELQSILTLQPAPAFLTPPPPVPEDAIREKLSADVVVVGEGLAGLSCALRARQSGADTLIVTDASAHIAAHIAAIIVISFFVIFFLFLSQSVILPLALGTKKKTSLRVFKRALRLPLLEHEERQARCASSA